MFTRSSANASGVSAFEVSPFRGRQDEEDEQRWAGSALGLDRQGVERAAFDTSRMSSDQGEVAMTPAEARQLVGSFMREAKRGSVTPDAFFTGMSMLGEYGMSADSIRRDLRNSLKTPIGRIIRDNPEIAVTLADTNLDFLRKVGINPDAAEKYLGVGAQVVRQAAKDGLLRDNVTVEQVRDKLQLPLHAAMREAANNRDPKLNALVRRAWPNPPTKGAGGRPITPMQAMLRQYVGY